MNKKMNKTGSKLTSQQNKIRISREFVFKKNFVNMLYNILTVSY